MTVRSRILFYLIAILLLLQTFTKIVTADEFDEEELVNSQGPEEPVLETFKDPVPEPKPIVVPTRPNFELSDFYREIFMIICIIVYLINYFIGKQINENIARKWMETHISLLRDNFALVGTGNDDSKPLIRDGPADYLFYLSGRRNCQYVHGRITLKARHNLIKIITNIIISQFSSNVIEDTVTFNVCMNGEEYDNFVFAITKKERSRELRGNRYDLQDFTKQVNNNLLPGSLCAQTESSEVTDTFLTKQLVEFLRKSENYLNAMIVTDQSRVRPEKTAENQPKLLMIISSIPDDLSKLNETLPVSELIMYMIDFIPARCSFRLETKNKLKKNRDDAEKAINKALEIERQEAIQQKKAEKKRAEAERVAKLSPEEQRKA
ncbi:10732_t:CDS:10 [Funneliformis mosseae]|uniref:10732_t:CDS:1 n=1 Tax=Funneliformis mosseae TaxID=27381 RepID=A0A9N8WEB1_FUNMO|nr:10732_t:CDS:10 [Funneliformis mosseae]